MWFASSREKLEGGFGKGVSLLPERNTITTTTTEVMATTPALPAGITWLDLRGAAATQSSLDAGGVAGRAIDGNAATEYGDGGCTHTAKQNNPWWEVDLGSQQAVVAVEVTGRNIYSSSRLSGFDVRVDGYMCASDDYK